MAPLAIAQVTPYAWDADHDVNHFVARTSAELADRGHRVLIVAPSSSHEAVREGRRALHDDPTALLRSGEPRVLAVGEALAHNRRVTLPIDVSRDIEALHAALALDVCHVHEPFAPSVASAALRHSRSLNVGTFHLPAERLVATQVARRMVELVFGRLDARTASFEATARLMDRHFPAAYRILRPAVPAPATEAGPRDPRHIAFVDEEERPALRAFLRALRLMPTEVEWRVTVLSARGPSSSTPLRAELRERVRFATFEDLGVDELLASAGVLVAASDGTLPNPGLLLRARAAGAAVLASRLPVYEEVLEEGTTADGGLAGRLFEPRDVDTLAAQLERALDAPAPEPIAQRPWSTVADELDDVYGRLVARRHGDGDLVVRERLRRRALIDVDLHMHTDHSPDCATPVEVLLATARDRGLGAIAVTDHNEVSGAFEAADKAAAFGVKVIVAEEVKTAEQGEVIGLFLTEKIPRGMSMAQTVAEIKRQGGLVYVPHPFDRMHAVPDYEHLLAIVEDIDALEVFNPRVAIGSFNEEAERFAAKYRIVAAAGSDSHVAQGLGSVRIRMRDFDGPQEFLESLREADILRRPTSLLYVQALKFLETTAIPSGARRARRTRRIERATRKS